MDRSAVAACGLCSTAMVVWMRLVPLLSGLVQVVVGGVFRAWVQTMGLAGRRDLGVALIQYCWASVGSMICKCMWWAMKEAAGLWRDGLLSGTCQGPGMSGTASSA